jgi:uncharacterized protein (DUF488 family)
LQETLAAAGIRYRFFGDSLGGRPAEDSFFDESGFVYYKRVARSVAFRREMDVLQRGAGQLRTAILCSETDPTACHRNLLVGRVARLRGMAVEHILKSGERRMFDDDLVASTGLPGMEEDDQWKSLVQVRQAHQQRYSSDV